MVAGNLSTCASPLYLAFWWPLALPSLLLQLPGRLNVEPDLSDWLVPIELLWCIWESSFTLYISSAELSES